MKMYRELTAAYTTLAGKYELYWIEVW
jgi:hypothetical protein